jgi:large subunit ribosomal protein L9
VLEVARQAYEEGKLFGSVTAQDVVEFLAAQGLTIERRRVQLDEPIKTLGETLVPIRLHPEVTSQVRVNVVRQ